MRGALRRGDNALNLIRLVLAGTVIVGHSWPIPGFAATPLVGGMDLGYIAVGGFFAISGYLVTASRSRLTTRQYLLRRARRILPAFWMCLTLTAFALVPAYTLLAHATWRPLQSLRYIMLNAALFVFQPTIQGTLTSAPGTSVWNGSLWTIGLEFAAYLVVALLFMSRLFRDRPLPVAVLVHIEFTVAWSLTHAHAAWLGAYFSAGMVLWALGDRFRPSWRTVAAAAAGAVLLGSAGLLQAFGGIPVAVLVLSLGTVLPWRIGSRNDFSYGVYLYGFPVQQLLVAARVHTVLGPWLFAAVSLVAVAPLALASWYLVERPALQRGSSAPRQAPGNGVVAEPVLGG